MVGATLRDRVRASDPGLGRLRQALSATVCVGTALPVQYAVGRMVGYPAASLAATTMFGAVVAMLGSNALVGSDRRGAWRTALFFPLAVACGLVPAALLDGQRVTQAVGFAVAMFLAVWVRRFGPRWFFYGFLGWMGFFFATFLQVDWTLVPELLLASVVSAAWVLLLTTTVLHADPGRVLQSTLAAFFAAGRAVAREAADVLEAGADDVRALRSLAARQAAMAETSLLAEAWSAEAAAVPPGWSASALRRRTLETQQAAERFGGAALGLHRLGERADPRLRELAREALDHLARRRDLAATLTTERLDELADRVREEGGDGWWPARHLAFGVREFLRFDAGADDPPELDPGEEEFEAATGLVFGGLPGSPAVAREVAVRGAAWNPLTRTSMTTRQAVQVALAGALAIVLGTVLSPDRYYWAVIATFITFTGTASRSETFLKGSARVAGTLLGIVAALGVAHLTAGRTDLVIASILLAIFAMTYLQKVSQTLMAACITILLGQLYTALGTFSDGLLALRLGETVVGALTGVAVALLLAPLSTRDTVRSARDELYDAMAALLDGVVAYAGGARVDLDARSRALDDRARRLALVAKPLVQLGGPGLTGTSRRMRRRLGLYVAAVSQCRALTLALQRRPVADPERTAASAAALAEAVRAMRTTPVGEAAPAAGDPLATGDRALFGTRPDDARAEDPVVRHLHHLTSTLAQLAETSPASPDRTGFDAGR